MNAARIEAHAVSVRLGGAVVLRDVSIHAGPGEVVGVVGPNGCGKSTLLKTLVGVLRPTSGCVRLDDVDITEMSARGRAQSVATVLQETPSDFDLCARDVVAMGRAPFKRMFERDDGADARLIEEALDLVDGRHMASVPIASMSGGERQRVMIARALAQQPRLLVLDEPTNHLDIRHQFDALALPRKLGVTAVIALHDLNLAAHYCDRICVMHGGRLVGSGPPAEVLTPRLLDEVYGVAARVRPHPGTGRPEVSYDPSFPAGSSSSDHSGTPARGESRTQLVARTDFAGEGYLM